MMKRTQNGNTPADKGIAAARHDSLPWKYSDNNTFRRLPSEKSMLDGKQVVLTNCETYIDGRSVAPIGQ